MLVDGNVGLLVERVAVLVQSAFFETLDEFQFVGLVGKNFLCLVRRDDRLLELMLALHDLAHPLFDLLQIFGREVARQIEVVVKAIFHGRTDGHLAIGE